MIRLRLATICACLGSVAVAACGDDADPGGGGTNTTTGSGPTTFATFSTTTPPVTTQPGSSGADSGESSGTAGSSDTGGSESDSSTTDDGLCPSTHVCTREAPKGWSGPVAVHTRDLGERTEPTEPKAPECGLAYPNQVETGFEGLQAEAAACACECGPANGVACDNSTTLRYWADDATCSDTFPQAVSIFASACNSVPNFPGNGHYTAEPLPAVGGACAPSTQTAVEAAIWSTLSSACSGGTIIDDAGCAQGRICAPVPESEDAALCIWQEGEHECPDDFDTQRVLFGDIEDDRGCETCSCAAPLGLCDSAFVSLWNGPTCLVPSAGAISANGECDPTGSGNSARAASLNAGSPSAFCAPSEPTPSGEAVGIDPVTICCADQ